MNKQYKERETRILQARVSQHAGKHYDKKCDLCGAPVSEKSSSKRCHDCNQLKTGNILSMGEAYAIAKKAKKDSFKSKKDRLMSELKSRVENNLHVKSSNKCQVCGADISSKPAQTRYCSDCRELKNSVSNKDFTEAKRIYNMRVLRNNLRKSIPMITTHSIMEKSCSHKAIEYLEMLINADRKKLEENVKEHHKQEDIEALRNNAYAEMYIRDFVKQEGRC